MPYFKMTTIAGLMLVRLADAQAAYPLKPTVDSSQLSEHCVGLLVSNLEYYEDREGDVIQRVAYTSESSDLFDVSVARSYAGAMAPEELLPLLREISDGIKGVRDFLAKHGLQMPTGLPRILGMPMRMEFLLPPRPRRVLHVFLYKDLEAIDAHSSPREVVVYMKDKGAPEALRGPFTHEVGHIVLFQLVPVLANGPSGIEKERFRRAFIEGFSDWFAHSVTGILKFADRNLQNAVTYESFPLKDAYAESELVSGLLHELGAAISQDAEKLVLASLPLLEKRYLQRWDALSPIDLGLALLEADQMTFSGKNSSLIEGLLKRRGIPLVQHGVQARQDTLDAQEISRLWETTPTLALHSLVFTSALHGRVLESEGRFYRILEGRTRSVSPDFEVLSSVGAFVGSVELEIDAVEIGETRKRAPVVSVRIASDAWDASPVVEIKALESAPSKQLSTALSNHISDLTRVPRLPSLDAVRVGISTLDAETRKLAQALFCYPATLAEARGASLQPLTSISAAADALFRHATQHPEHVPIVRNIFLVMAFQYPGSSSDEIKANQAVRDYLTGLANRLRRGD